MTPKWWQRQLTATHQLVLAAAITGSFFSAYLYRQTFFFRFFFHFRLFAANKLSPSNQTKSTNVWRRTFRSLQSWKTLYFYQTESCRMQNYGQFQSVIYLSIRSRTYSLHCTMYSRLVHKHISNSFNLLLIELESVFCFAPAIYYVGVQMWQRTKKKKW